MANLVVYVFLLDNLAGFNSALNESLMSTDRAHVNTTTKQCDTSTTEQVLNAVSRELDINFISPFKKPFYRRSFADVNSVEETPQEDTQEYLLGNALAEVSDTSIMKTDRKDKYYKKLLDTFEFDSNQLDVQNIKEPVTEFKELIHENKETSDNITQLAMNVANKVEFPNTAPFLVAIFETLMNTTAQTCAGTLIAPHWVLTASNCLNILSTLYANDTNMTDQQSLYTVVAGATNPLSDGSVHNITTVHLHHGTWENTTKKHKSVHAEIGPYLAMLHIEPEVVGAGLQLVEEKNKKWKKTDVMIYGWILAQVVPSTRVTLTPGDDFGESLRLVMMSAQILSSVECQAMYNYNDNDVICLYNNNKDRNITELSSGGPVLILQDNEVKMLAVVQTDEQVFIAYPVHIHIDWIKKILNYKM